MLKYLKNISITLSIIAFIACILFSGYSVYSTGNFDPVAFSTGIGAIIVGLMSVRKSSKSKDTE